VEPEKLVSFLTPPADLSCQWALLAHVEMADELLIGYFPDVSGSLTLMNSNVTIPETLFSLRGRTSESNFQS